MFVMPVPFDTQWWGTTWQKDTWNSRSKEIEHESLFRGNDPLFGGSVWILQECKQGCSKFSTTKALCLLNAWQNTFLAVWGSPFGCKGSKTPRNQTKLLLPSRAMQQVSTALGPNQTRILPPRPPPPPKRKGSVIEKEYQLPKKAPKNTPWPVPFPWAPTYFVRKASAAAGRALLPSRWPARPGAARRRPPAPLSSRRADGEGRRARARARFRRRARGSEEPFPSVGASSLENGFAFACHFVGRKWQSEPKFEIFFAFVELSELLKENSCDPRERFEWARRACVCVSPWRCDRWKRSGAWKCMWDMAGSWVVRFSFGLHFRWSCSGSFQTLLRKGTFETNTDGCVQQWVFWTWADTYLDKPATNWCRCFFPCEVAMSFAQMPNLISPTPIFDLFGPCLVMAPRGQLNNTSSCLPSLWLHLRIVLRRAPDGLLIWSSENEARRHLKTFECVMLFFILLFLLFVSFWGGGWGGGY